MTNFEYIKSLDIDELAEFIRDDRLMCLETVEKKYGIKFINHLFLESSKQITKLWLEQERSE